MKAKVGVALVYDNNEGSRLTWISEKINYAAGSKLNSLKDNAISKKVKKDFKIFQDNDFAENVMFIVTN